MRRGILVLLVMAGMGGLWGCDTAQDRRTEEVRAQLVGTWLHEAESGRVKQRRVLTLGSDGQFRDRLSVATAGEGTARQDFGGEWSYDGTHFKRRYLQQDGRQFSGGKIRFATFPLVSVSRTDFVVDDNIQGEKVTFRRVPEGTEP